MIKIIIPLICIFALLTNGYIFHGNNIIVKKLRSTYDFSRYCIDKVTKPIPFKPGVREDNDNSWRTVINPDIEFVKMEKFVNRPDLITFDAFNTLIEPNQGIGKWYREALNAACNFQIRLPRPIFFADSFKNAYNEM
jgi:hypothetical protein